MSGDIAQSLYGTPTAATPAPAVPAADATTSPAADVLYATPAPAPVVVAADANVVEPVVIDVLTPDAIKAAVPDAIADARKANQERMLYTDSERDAIAESLPMTEMAEVAPETVAAMRVELGNMAIDAGATPADVQLFSRALADANSNPLSDDARLASRNDCAVAFRNTYGGEAQKTLDITVKWLNSDPRRAAMFAPLGDNPQVALLAARLALAAQRRR